MMLIIGTFFQCLNARLWVASVIVSLSSKFLGVGWGGGYAVTFSKVNESPVLRCECVHMCETNGRFNLKIDSWAFSRFTDNFPPTLNDFPVK